MLVVLTEDTPDEGMYHVCNIQEYVLIVCMLGIKHTVLYACGATFQWWAFLIQFPDYNDYNVLVEFRLSDYSNI